MEKEGLDEVVPLPLLLLGKKQQMDKLVLLLLLVTIDLSSVDMLLLLPNIKICLFPYRPYLRLEGGLPLSKASPPRSDPYI